MASSRSITRGADLTGQLFGELTVVSLVPYKKNVKKQWVCHCKCGNVVEVLQGHLRNGHTSSCGCRGAGRSQLGLSRTPTHSIWAAMKHRCSNISCAVFKWYGGRGIKVCDRWQTFNSFIKDMGPRPSGYSLERVDVNGDYEPSNCKWIPRFEQASNMRSNVWITAGGFTRTVAQWARVAGIDSRLICTRRRRGWPDAQAVGLICRESSFGEGKTTPNRVPTEVVNEEETKL